MAWDKNFHFSIINFQFYFVPLHLHSWGYSIPDADI